jgi:multidrug efflux pump subunit AcrA (membrane-fusion protein)
MTTSDGAPVAERPDPPATPTSFRDRALGDVPNPLEHIDHLFRQTSKRIWLGVLGLAVLLGGGVLWAGVATQSVTSEAQAVIVPPRGIFTAGAFEAGVVTSVTVKEGTVVDRGERLADVRLADSARKVFVRSPVAGRVIGVDARPGELSQAGSSMFRIAPVTSRPMAIGLFAASAINQLAVGQKVAVAVNAVPPERYGKAVGRVASIGPIPANEQRLRQLTGDSSLVGIPERLGPVREVRIRLTPARTPSGLKWTRGKGPAGPIPIGAGAVVSVTIKRETLIGKAFG